MDAGHERQEIALIVGVDTSTISREVKRNRRTKRIRGRVYRGRYESSVAEHKAYLRRWHAKWRWKKIDHECDLEAYIVEKLKQHWSPDEIAGKMRRERRPFYASKTAIYEWLHTGRGARYCQYLYSGRDTVKRRVGPQQKKTLIPHRISIHERPLGATNKTRYGHWEGDTMVSAKKTASRVALSVVYERKAKFIAAEKVENLKPSSHNRAIIRMLANKKALSLSQDNGIENTKHEELGVRTFFCDPYSSWQKGGVENANKMIRRYIPKGSDIGDYSDAYVTMAVNIINHKPRKSLGYRTPYEVMVEHHLFVPSTDTAVALRG